MRQVPHYLLIGDGRVSRHFQHYFSLLGLSFSVWQYRQPVIQLSALLRDCTHILLLVPDRAIDEFITSHLSSTQAVCLHFSGSLVSQHAYGAHPLMTFAADFYTLLQYQEITFVVDDNAPAFIELLPGLPNQHVRLNTALKAKYHALCVLSGNFSCLLWQKLFTSFEQELGLDASIAHAYLKQQTHNLLLNAESALTGPLTRGDMQTVKYNLQALQADPFQQVYQSFVQCYLQNKNAGKITNEYT